ncbi:aromatic-ring-hydroxylating dioxygenase subunit beta [Enemella sp. A6]|uniref:aromatic-ring-hydroxylating dioxygenase subunit beta n=1 Tax=Enemella sp. A6 TaxID=3440152 RepID=UPI003EB91E22
MSVSHDDPRLTGVSDPQTTNDLRTFLYLEALALEERRFRDWLQFWAPEATYQMPVRITREAGAEWELAPKAHVFDDTKRSLEIRVERLETEFAWAEQPPSRTRRYVTNVLVFPGEQPEQYVVRSNVLIYRSRGDDPVPSLLSVQRRDTIVRDGDSWLITERWGALDQSLVNAHNLSIFF